MDKEQYKIGIVDDDPSKVTQMITMLRLCCNDDDGQPVKEKYVNYELIPVEIELIPIIGEMVELSAFDSDNLIVPVWMI